MAVGEIIGFVVQAGAELAGTLVADTGHRKDRIGAVARLVLLLPVAVICALLATVIFREPIVEFGHTMAGLICSATSLGALYGSYRAVRVLGRATEPAPPEA